VLVRARRPGVVGEREQLGRNFEPERFRSLEVDEEVEVRRLSLPSRLSAISPIPAPPSVLRSGVRLASFALLVTAS
jgi:hypothetical protein